MQFRFVIWNEKNENYTLLGYCDIDSYDTAWRMFTIMKEMKCNMAVQLSDCVDSNDNTYCVKNVTFVTASLGADLLPHIMIELEDCF